MKYKTLENTRVRLTPLRKDDIIHLEPVAFEDPELLAYSPSSIHSPQSLTEYLGIAIKERYPFLIFDKRNHAYAGSTSYGNYSAYHQRIEIGWSWIGKKFQGTGLNTAMKMLMLQHAFESEKMERVEFKIDSRNIRSRKAIEKLGAVYEGKLRSHTLMLDGFRRDTVYYSILKDEWEDVKNRIASDLR